MFVSLLVKTVEYYVSNNFTLYVLLIEASKAFDRLCHSKLFELLETYNVFLLVIRFLYNIYYRSELHLQWHSSRATPCVLQCRVKQGEVVSPILFSIYIDSI